MKTFFTLVVLLFLCPAQSHGQDHLSMETFKSIAIMHEGRIKPLDSFASLKLKQISSGSVNFDHNQWLATTIFDPQSAAKAPIFKIKNKSVLTMFSLEPSEKSLYSLNQIAPALAKTEKTLKDLITLDPSNLTPDQQAFISAHANALNYAQLLKSLAPILPLPIELPDYLEIGNTLSEEGPTFIELKKIEPQIIKTIKEITAKKGDDIEAYTDEEKRITSLGFDLQVLGLATLGDNSFSIVPSIWQKDEAWSSPSTLIESGKGSPLGKKYLETWQKMAISWRKSDVANWNKLTIQAKNQSLAMIVDQPLLPYKFKTEIFYHTLNPFFLAKWLLGLSIFFTLLSMIKHSPQLNKANYLAAATATVCLLAGISMRVFILDRPPVGSLYKSLLFVALIVMITCLILEQKRNDRLSLIGGVCASLLIIAISPYIAPKADDLEMLTAVLNTNFWLATHVLCITAGYGLCILTATLSHFDLAGQTIRLKTKNMPTTSDGLASNIYILSLLALFFTAFGTVLGGIWADQSWGRFWGWDPKENGALLIVLWLIWVHHGRHSGYLNRDGFNAAMAFLNIIVALAWFGVNLLNVGLHSYGFISGIAAGLAIFCSFEITLIGVLYLRAHKRRQLKNAN